MNSISSRRRRFTWAFVGCTAAAAAAAACSIVNAFDDVKRGVDAGASDAGDGDASDAGPTDDGPVDTGAVEAGDAAPKGVVVLGATQVTDAGPQFVLTALAPEDGTELPRAREKMVVSAALYDGLRDLWFIFESHGADFFPSPTDAVTLHVRELDTHTGQWTNLQNLEVPPPVSFALITVLRSRIVYVAYHPRSGTVEAGTPDTFDLVTLDTNNANAVQQYDVQPLSEQGFGVIGTRSSTGVGGVVNLLRTSGCDGGGFCRQLTMAHVIVPPPPGKPSISAAVPLRTFMGTAGFGSYLTGNADVIAAVAAGGTQLETTLYSPQVPGTQTGSYPSFFVLGPFLKPLAFDECMHQALAIETNQDLAVYSIPLVPNGTPKRLETGHSGQGVYFEPYTKTVLAPFSQGQNFALTAIRLGGSAPQPTLTLRDSDWHPPPDLRPNIVATRTPLPIVCEQ